MTQHKLFPWKRISVDDGGTKTPLVQSSVAREATVPPSSAFQSPYPGGKPGYHRGGLETERDAAEAVAVDLTARQKAAYLWLKRRGDEGGTDDQGVNDHHYSYARRRCELSKLDPPLVRPKRAADGTICKRMTMQGCHATVWVVCGDVTL